MRTPMFLLVAPYPMPSILRQLAATEAAAEQLTDFEAARTRLRRERGPVGVLLGAGPALRHRRLALSLLVDLRRLNPILPVGLMLPHLEERAIREAAKYGAQPLLLPCGPSELARFAADALRSQPVRDAITQVAIQAMIEYGIRPHTRPAQVLLLRALGRTPREVCAELRITMPTYRSHAKALAGQTDVAGFEGVVHAIVRRAQEGPPPNHVGHSTFIRPLDPQDSPD